MGKLSAARQSGLPPPHSLGLELHSACHPPEALKLCQLCNRRRHGGQRPQGAAHEVCELGEGLKGSLHEGWTGEERGDC